VKFTRVLAIVSVALGVLGLAVPVGAQTLSVIGASSKICQLTGQTDWFSGQTTDAQTQSRYGLFGVDLGFPVESPTGQLLLLFGDTVPNGHPPNTPLTVPPDDAVGVTSRTAAPDASTCLDMKMLSPGPGALGHPTVTPAIQQGAFNVPTGGISVGGQVYAFFWTNHCVFVDPFGPNSSTPLTLPAPGAGCPENALSNSLGRSVLAVASPSAPLAYAQVAPMYAVLYVPQMPNGFVYVTAAVPPPRIVKGHVFPALTIPVFGVARYRMGIPYLALAPRATFGNFQTWAFYGGPGPSGPIWLTYQQWQSGHVGNQWAPPTGAEIYANSANAYSLSGDERCVGEHSVTWNAPLHAWLMLYACGGLQVEARTAPQPWGPWSKPTIILSAVQNPGLYCTLFWNLPGGGCPGLTSQQIPALSFGAFYAPFTMTRFTQAATPQAPAPSKAATIYWLLSTWDPYQVTVMQSTLQLAP